MNRDVHNHTAVSQDGIAVGKPSGNGGTGAPPSNTAPANDKTGGLQPIGVFHQGIDSLYLSFPGSLKEDRERLLATFKANAKDRDALTGARCIYQHGDHGPTFSVLDKGAGRFKYILINENYNIRLSSGSALRLPLASVQVRSHYLMKRAFQDIVDELTMVLRGLGELEDDARVSRLDLCVDFAAADDLFSIPREAWVGRARAVQQHWDGGRSTGWSIGLGAPLSCRLYDKTVEIEKSQKLYMQAIWADAGWLGELPVYRLEFQVKREVLKQLGLRIADDTVGLAGPIWRYAMQQWLRLTRPNPSDSRCARWPMHPAWEALSQVEWYVDDLTLPKRLQPPPSSDESWAIKNFRAAIVNYMAHKQIDSPYEASDQLFVEVMESCQREARFGEKKPEHVLEDRARKKASQWGRPFATALSESRQIEARYTASSYRHRK